MKMSPWDQVSGMGLLSAGGHLSKKGATHRPGDLEASADQGQL